MSSRLMTAAYALLALILAFSMLVAALCLPAHGDPAGDTLTFVGSQHPPWHFKGSEGQLVGINVDLTKEICSRMGVKCDFKFMPWARGWESILTGQADAIMSASRKKARMKHLYYPQTDFRTSEYVFFVHKHKMDRSIRGTYEDIAARHYTVGIQIGASYDPEFWKHFPYWDKSTTYAPDKRNYHKALKPVANPLTNFRKLADQRIQVLPFDREVGLYQIKLLGFTEKLTHYPHVLFSKGYPIAFSKKSTHPSLKQIAVQFEQEFIRLKEDGTYQAVMEEWFQYRPELSDQPPSQ